MSLYVTYENRKHILLSGLTKKIVSVRYCGMRWYSAVELKGLYLKIYIVVMFIFVKLYSTMCHYVFSLCIYIKRVCEQQKYVIILCCVLYEAVSTTITYYCNTH